MMATTPSRLWFLAPWLEVMGSEMNWNYNANGAHLQIPSCFTDEQSAIKPYCIPNSNLTTSGWSNPALHEAFLFYGFYPSYFSADVNQALPGILSSATRPPVQEIRSALQIGGRSRLGTNHAGALLKSTSHLAGTIWREVLHRLHGSDESASATISLDKPIAKLLDRVSEEYTVSGKSISVTLNSEDVMFLEAIQ